MFLSCKCVETLHCSGNICDNLNACAACLPVTVANNYDYLVIYLTGQMCQIAFAAPIGLFVVYGHRILYAAAFAKKRNSEQFSFLCKKFTFKVSNNLLTGRHTHTHTTAENGRVVEDCLLARFRFIPVMKLLTPCL